MKTVPVYEAKNRFSELLAAVEQGDTEAHPEMAVPRKKIARIGVPSYCVSAAPATGCISSSAAFRRPRNWRKPFMTDIAKASDLGRENHCNTLRPGAHPRFDTVLKVAQVK